MSEPEYNPNYDPDDVRDLAELAKLQALEAAGTIREAHESGQLATLAANLLRERDALKAEVARLRGEIQERERADRENEAACQEIARRIDAENRKELAREAALEKQLDALRAKVEQLLDLHAAVCGRNEALTDERDALADALEGLLIYVPGQIGDPGRAALRLVGRPPREES